MTSFILKHKDNENQDNKYFKKSYSYYQKIYSIHSDDEAEYLNNNKLLLRQKKLNEQKRKIKSLKRIFNNRPLSSKKNLSNIDKVIHPKLPFSYRNKEEKEIARERIRSARPNKLYNDFHTIEWLRKKYSDSVIEQSVFSVLPKEGKPKISKNESENKKRKRKMIEYLESFKGPIGREKYVKINPKYFYNHKTYDKIMKLKEIFLEFDGGGKRKIQMNELINLFNQNHIRADVEELVNLFFKDKKIKKEDYLKLYLNFYQFIKFAIDQEEDFRQFMRKIKEKYEKNNEVEENNKEKSSYLPMNINLVLDYFLTKGKERSSIEKIEKSLNEIDKIIKSNYLNYNHNSQKNLNYSNLNMRNSDINKYKNNIKSNDDTRNNGNINAPKRVRSKNHTMMEIKNFTKRNLRLKKEEEEKEEIFDNINIKDLIKEFSNLFNYNKLTKMEYTKYNNSAIYNHNIKYYNNNSNTYNKSKSIKLFSPLNLKSSKNNIKLNNHYNPFFYEYGNNENEIIGDLVKYQMNQKTLLKMNAKNYEKYHDIKVAIEATKKQISKYCENDNNNISIIKKNNISKKSLKKSNSQRILKSSNKKNIKHSIDNNYKNINIFNKNRQLSKYNNNDKYMKNYQRNENVINNNSINCFSESIKRHYSKFNDSKNTFYQNKTGLISKRKFDSVPPELLI